MNLTNKDTILEIFNNLSKEEKTISKDIMDKYNFDIDDIVEHIKNMRIYIDFDDIIVDLIPAWVEWINNNNLKKENGEDYKLEDITYFEIFNDIKSKDGKLTAMNFLDDMFLYQSKEELKKINPNLLNERKFNDIQLKKETLEFFNILKESDLLKYCFIVTSTSPQTYYSKHLFVKEHLPKELHNNLITTGQKKVMNYYEHFSIFIDDAIHNHINVSKENDYSIGFVLNAYHNQELKTGKRIHRINSLSENNFFQKLILSAISDLGKKVKKSINNELVDDKLLNNIVKRNQDIRKENSINDDYQTLFETLKEFVEIDVADDIIDNFIENKKMKKDLDNLKSVLIDTLGKSEEKSNEIENILSNYKENSTKVKNKNIKINLN